MTEDSPERKARIARIAERMYGKPMEATYHPIDKPTEPGWYWCQQPNGRFDALEVIQGMMLTDGEPVMCIMPVGQGIIPADNLDGWYGPAIQPPQKEPA